MATTTPAYDLTKCQVCSVSASDKALMMCTRCKAVKYFGKDCQKTDWPSHKPHCPKPAASASSSSANASSSQPTDPDAKPFTAIYNGNYLHNRTPEKTYQILIDCLRIRQEDVYNLDQDNMDGTIMARLPKSEPAFRAFIAKAKRVPKLLPPWWDKDSLDACLEYSRHSGDFSLEHSVEKSDVQTQWGDDSMPMKLRMIGEKVYGNKPGGSRGEAMLHMKMMMEQGGSGMHETGIDMSGVFARR